MRWNIKRTKLLFALIPIISIVFYVFTANHDLYADQTFVAFDIYQQISDTMKPVEGKDTPDYYTAAENFAIAADVYLNAPEASVTTNGTVTAMGFYKQTVINFRAKRDGEIFSESVSLSSLASVAEQRYFRDGAILYRPGITAGNSVKGWSENITELSASVYRQRYGVVPREISKYSVTGESIISEGFVSKNSDGTYTYKLVLDPDEAQKYARYEMMTYAKVTSFPEFYSCEIVFTIDANWRMLKLEARDEYKIALMNGTKCSSHMVDTFAYDNITMPERTQIFKDYVITGFHDSITEKDGPAEYLGKAFGDYISGEKTLYLTAKADLIIEEFDIAAEIDIAGGIYRFTLGNDIFVVYKDDCVYLMLGDNRYKLTTDDAKKVIGDLGLDLGKLLPGSADDMLDMLFKDCSITETETEVHVIMPFNTFGFDIKVDMGLLKQGDGGVTADTINGTIYYGILPVDIDVEIVDSVAMPEFDESEFVDLKPAIDATVNTLSLPAYNLCGTLSVDALENTPIDYDLHIVKTALGADIEGTLTVAGTDISVWFIGGETVYLKAGNIGVKAGVNDMPALIAAVSALLPEGTMPEINTDELISTVLPAKNLDGIMSLAENIAYDGETITLTVTPANGEVWTAEIVHTDILSSLKLSGLDIMGLGTETTATLTAAEDTEVAPVGEFIDANDLGKFIPAIEEYISAERYSLENINADITVNGAEIKIGGNAVIGRGTTEAAATLTVGDTELYLVYRGGNAYISVGELKVKYNIGDLVSDAPASEDTFGAVAAILGTTEISEIIGKLGVAYENNTITAVADLGEKVELNFTLPHGVKVVCRYFTLSCDLKADDTAVIPQINESEYAELEPAIDAVKATLALPAYKLCGTLSVDALEGTPIDYDLRIVKTETGADIEGALTVAGVNISVWFVGGETVYLSSGNISVKAGVNDMPALIAAVSALLPEGTVPEVNTDELISTVLPTLDMSGIMSLAENTAYDGETITLTVSPANGEKWSAEITHADRLSAVTVSGLRVMGYGIETTATLTEAEAAEVTPVGEFTDANDLAPYLSTVKDLLRSQNYLVELPSVFVTVEDTEISLGGEFVIGRAPFAFSGTLRYGDINIDLRYASNNIYVTVGEFTAECTVAELCDILYELGLPVPENYAEFVTMLADWHINIPDELSVPAWLSIVTLKSENGALTLELDLGESFLGFTFGVGDTLYSDAVFTHPVFGASAAGIKVTGCKAAPAAPPEGKHFELKKIIPLIAPVRELVGGKTFRVNATLTLNKNGLSEEARLVCDVSTEKGVVLMGSVRLSQQAVDFVYDGGTVYLTVGNIRIKAAIGDIGAELFTELTPLLSDAGAFVEHISHLLTAEQTQTAANVISKLNELLNNIGSSGESGLAEILGKLTFLLPELNVESITALLSKVEINGSNVFIPITTADGSEYSVSAEISGGKTEAVVEGLDLYGYGIGIDATVESGIIFDYAAAGVDPDAYIAPSELVSWLPTLSELLKGEYFALDISDAEINTSIISATVSGRVELALDPLTAQAELTLRDAHKVSFVYYHGTQRIYLKLNDIYLTATVSEIQAFVDELSSLTGVSGDDAATLADIVLQTAEVTSLIEKMLGGKTLKDIVSLIDKLSVDDGKLTVTAHYDDLSATAELTASDGVLGIDLTNLNYGNVVYDSHCVASLNAIDALTSYELDYSDYVKLTDIQSFVRPVIDSFSSSYYHLSFGGKVVDEQNKVTTIDNGELKVQFTQGFANIYLRINLAGKTGDQKVELYLIDGTDYTEENTAFDKEKLSAFVNYNGFYAKIDYVATVGIINSACDILNVRIPILEKFLGEYDHIETDVFETMDIVGLNDLRDTLNSLFDTATDVTDAAGGDSGILMGLLGMISDETADKVLLGVSIKPDGDKLTVGIDNGIFSLLNSGKYAAVSIAQKDALLDFVDISGLMVNGDTVSFTASFTYEEFSDITAPDGATDFSSIHTLLRSLIRTADLREFHITGTLSLNVLGLIKPNIGIDAKVKILGDGSTVAAIKLSVPYVSMVVSAALTRTDSYIYFVNNRLYFIADIWDSGALTEGSYRQNTETKSATVEEFLSDPTEYLFFLLRMNDTIKNPIVNAINGGSSGTPSKNLNDIIKSYGYSNNTFSLTLGLKELSGNSDLSNLNLSITQKDGYISGLALDTKFVSVVSLALKNTTLTNLTTDENGVVNGCSPVGDVSFGMNNAVNAHSFSKNIDDLEDDLALLFPIEAAETLGDKAANKAAKANRLAADAEKAMKAVDESLKALGEMRDEYKKVSDKLDAAVKDSFGYDRLVAQKEYAAISLSRAESDYRAALKNRVTVAEKAGNAAMDAYTYAVKAAQAANNALSHTLDIRTAQVASNASTAALKAMLASRSAMESAIKAATAAGNDGEATLGTLNSLKAEITATEKSTAYETANAAIRACDYALPFVESRNDALNASLDTADSLALAGSAKALLGSVTAINSASEAATTAANVSENADTIAAAENTAKSVSAITETAANDIVTASVKAARALKATAEAAANAAKNATETYDITSNAKTALDTIAAAENAAKTAVSAAKLIGGSAEQVVAEIDGIKASLGDKLTAAVTTAANSYADALGKFVVSTLSDLGTAKNALSDMMLALGTYAQKAYALSPTAANKQLINTAYVNVTVNTGKLLSSSYNAVSSLTNTATVAMNKAISSVNTEAKGNTLNNNRTKVRAAAESMTAAANDYTLIAQFVNVLSDSFATAYKAANEAFPEDVKATLSEAVTAACQSFDSVRTTLYSTCGTAIASGEALSTYTNEKLAGGVTNNTKAEKEAAQNAVITMTVSLNLADSAISDMQTYLNALLALTF